MGEAVSCLLQPLEPAAGPGGVSLWRQQSPPAGPVARPHGATLDEWHSRACWTVLEPELELELKLKLELEMELEMELQEVAATRNVSVATWDLLTGG